MTLADRAWRYTAVDGAGRRVSDTVRAADAGAAARALEGAGLTPVKLDEATAARGSGRDRGFKPGERVLVLRQLALMVGAGVNLLEALRTVAEGVEAARGRAELEAVATALTRGDGFAAALERHAPGFPLYVYAMTRVGESTGRVGDVLRDASEQLAYEDRLRRDMLNALTYPAFLLCAGAAAIMFIFTQVVPRFAVMIGDEKRTAMPWSSRLVLDVGLWVSGHLPLFLIGLGVLVAGALAASRDPRTRSAAYDLGRRLPLVGTALRAREVMSWARLTGFSLSNGLVLLDAAALSRQATPEGPFRRGLLAVEAELKAGVAVETALGRHTPLSGMDLSLIRAGAKSGALPRMFAVLADGYDNRLRDLVKRLTALVEPIAIGGIAVIVGAVALSLVLALSSVYETVS